MSSKADTAHLESDKKVTQALLLQKNAPKFSLFTLLALFLGTDMDLYRRQVDLMRFKIFGMSQLEGADLSSGGGGTKTGYCVNVSRLLNECCSEAAFLAASNEFLNRTRRPELSADGRLLASAW